MKKYLVSTLTLLIIALALPACSLLGAGPSSLPTEMVSTSAMTASPSPASETIPTPSPSPSPVQFIPTGEMWYDWDELGVFPVDMEWKTELVADTQYMFYTRSMKDRSKAYWGDNLYRADLDGSNVKELDTGLVDNISCLNGWVYYSKKDGIYKIDYNDENEKKLSKDRPFVMFVHDGDVIYSSENSSGIYKLDRNGKTKRLLEDDYALCYFDNESDTLYLGEKETDQDIYNIYAYKMADKTLTPVAHGIDLTLITYKGNIYYEGSDDSENRGIICLDYRSGTKRIVSDLPEGEPVWGWTRFDKWILVNTYSSNRGSCDLYAYDLETGETSKMLSGIGGEMVSTPLCVYIDYCGRLFFKDGKAIYEALKNPLV